MLSFHKVKRWIAEQQELSDGFQFVNVNVRRGRFDELLLRFQKRSTNGMPSQDELDEILGEEIRVFLASDFPIGDRRASDICGGIA